MGNNYLLSKSYVYICDIVQIKITKTTYKVKVKTKVGIFDTWDLGCKHWWITEMSSMEENCREMPLHSIESLHIDSKAQQGGKRFRFRFNPKQLLKIKTKRIISTNL